MSFNEYWQGEQQRRALAGAIEALRPDQPDSEQRFLAVAAVATLFMPLVELPEGVEEGEIVRGLPGMQLRVTMARHPNGTQYLPLFTSEERVRTSPFAARPHVLIPFTSAARMALQARVAGILIDQGPARTALVTAPLLRALSARAEGAPQPASAPRGQLRVAPPPRPLQYRELGTLREWLERQPEVVEAFLFGLHRPEQPPILTVGIGALDPIEKTRIAEMAREVGALMGGAGLLALDGRLATLLRRQPGAIRFELRDPETA